MLVPSHLNPRSPLPGGIFGRAVHPYAQGQGSGVRRNSSGALSLRHRTARMQQFSAAKGINAQVFCAHSMKTVMRTSFCTAKGKFWPQFAFRGKRRPPPAAICLRSSLTTFKTGRDRQKHVAAKCQYMWHFLLLSVAILQPQQYGISSFTILYPPRCDAHMWQVERDRRRAAAT